MIVTDASSPNSLNAALSHTEIKASGFLVADNVHMLFKKPPQPVLGDV
jgi:hypothetical protein